MPTNVYLSKEAPCPYHHGHCQAQVSQVSSGWSQLAGKESTTAMNDLSRILEAVVRGDWQAAERLLPSVQSDLRRLAARKLGMENPGPERSDTPRAHEADLPLPGEPDAGTRGSRGPFFLAAAEAIRQVLIDNARRQQGPEPDPGPQPLEFDEGDRVVAIPGDQLLVFDAALEQLARDCPREAQLVKLHCFGGLAIEDAADLLGIPADEAHRSWTFSRAFLTVALAGEDSLCRPAGGPNGVNAEARRIVTRALEEGPEARDGFVERACGDDDRLRRMVEALLRACEDPAHILDRPFVRRSPGEDTPDHDRADESAGFDPGSGTVYLGVAHKGGTPRNREGQADRRPPLLQVPGYEILGELGRGGMGVVYRARQIRAGRVVALKMILAEEATSGGLERFRAEGEALGRLQHPGIVQVFEVGEHQGHPFLSLEFCPHGSLDRYLGGTPLPPREAAQLILELSRAIQAAHQAQVIHRDLKPANVLLAPRPGVRPGPDPSGATGRMRPPLSAFVPKLTDFGLARRLDEASRTMPGVILGTPSYMAPEQAQGERNLGPATDVYALGTILYECLVGRPPFRAASALGTMHQVAHDEPVAPRQLQPGTPRDLETICLKCLRKAPGQRYATAQELADDLDRFLDGRPITARRAGPLERGWRWCRRNPVVAGLLASVVFVLVLGIVVSDLAWSRALHNAGLAERKGREATRLADDLKEQSDRLARELEKTRRSLFASQLVRAGALAEEQPAEAYRLLHDYKACPLDLRSHAWNFYARRCKRDLWTGKGHKGPVRSVAYSPDGKLIASGGHDKTVKLWDAATGKVRATLRGHAHPIHWVAFSPDGTILASASGTLQGRPPSSKGEIKLWDVATGKEQAKLEGKVGFVGCLCFSPDGRTLVSAGGRFDDRRGRWVSEFKRWDLATRREQMGGPGQFGSDRVLPPWTLDGEPYTFSVSCLFSPDGKLLATVRQKRLELWDVRTGRLAAALGDPRPGWISSIHFSPDGKTLAASRIHAIDLWHVANGTLKNTLRKGRLIEAVRFSPDGKTLASAEANGEIVLCDAETGERRMSLRKRAPQIASLSFSPDGKTLASAHGDWGDKVDGQINLWNLTPNHEQGTRIWPFPYVETAALSSDGTTLATSAQGPAPAKGYRFQVWAVADGKERIRLNRTFRAPKPAGYKTPIALSPDGKTFAFAGDGRIHLWEVALDRETASWEVPGRTYCLAFGEDGKTLASAQGKVIALWDVPSGESRATLEGHADTVRALAFARKDRLLASASDDRTVKLWSLPDGRLLTTFRDRSPRPSGFGSLSFSRDAGTLAGGVSDGRAYLWDLDGNKEIATFSGTVVALSPDGKTLATALHNNEICLWDTVCGQLQATFQRPDSTPVEQLVFSPDGRTLISKSHREVVRWDLSAPPEVALLEGDFPFTAVAFSTEGKTLRATDNQGGRTHWDLTTGRLLDAVPEVDFRPPSRRSPDGKLEVTIEGRQIRLTRVPPR